MTNPYDLPEGPWGYQEHDPIGLPAGAWEQTCTREVGPYNSRQVCGATLLPNPADVFFYVEWDSTAVTGLVCRSCGGQLAQYAWPLTESQHVAVFGRTREEYQPSDGVQYSVWRTADRGELCEFWSLREVLRSEDHDWRTVAPGELTVRQWGMGVEWDGAEFAAAHADGVAAEYAADPAGDEGWYTL